MTLNIAVLDMQPIAPPTGGGRLRLLGLYHDLGARAHYLGTYDWPGPGFRRQHLSPTLEEHLVPLSAAHFAAAAARSGAVSGRTVIDCTFPELAHLSPDYVMAAREAVRSADVVVFSHPWIFPLVRDAIDPATQRIVYDAHNVEGMLRMALLDDGGAGTEIVRNVVKLEYTLCHAADLIFACSDDDRSAFARLYGVSHDRIRVVPNGTFTETLKPASTAVKISTRQKLGIGNRPVAFFIGSDYAPNIEAARFIAAELCARRKDVLFVIAGGAGERVAKAANLILAGTIAEDAKRDWLHAADIALNPMFGGSGTNIKMLDFMAAGLPIVTTPVGARGIDTDREAFVVADISNFAVSVEALLQDRQRRNELGEAARAQAVQFYSWECISRATGTLLGRCAAKNERKPPFFSVVIPTYERHDLLTRMVELLAIQKWRDFEVIIVDQSGVAWPDQARDFGLDICYVHTNIRGAVKARNSGANLALGSVLAFIDDDCEPSPDWLSAAQAEFAAKDIVGLEGLIVSDHVDDPDWRPVTNDGFEGLGFMTANLFVRAEAFHAINGFDVAFDNPHFREDTDLGWRAQALGAIPFSRDAWVFHPAQPRSLERESLATRSRFFEKDALLARKHPQKYAVLLRREAQWTRNPHFWHHFMRGVVHYKVELPEEIVALVPKDFRSALTLCRTAKPSPDKYSVHGTI